MMSSFERRICMKAKKSAAKKSAGRKTGARRTPNVIAMLTEDHNKVKKMFKEFEGLKEGKGDQRKQDLAQQICQELTVHTMVEEEIVYPAAREEIDEEDILDEADVEHASAKQLIQQIQKMKPGDDHFDATVKVLGEYVNHHVKEEQTELFKQMRQAKMDLADLGTRVMERKAELEGSGEAMGRSAGRRGESRTQM